MRMTRYQYEFFITARDSYTHYIFKRLGNTVIIFVNSLVFSLSTTGRSLIAKYKISHLHTIIIFINHKL